MTGKASRDKGARGEVEFARLLRSYGFNAERTGRNGRTSEDETHDVPGVHFEVKRCEVIEMSKWLRQAEGDAPFGSEPVVAFRRSREPWRVVVSAGEFLRLKALERDAA